MPANSSNSLDVAAAIVERINPIGPAKLQKLVFYAAGEYAALTGESLFPENIEAWDYGPVVYSLWKTYKSFEADGDILESQLGDVNKLNDLAKGCIASVVAKYGAFSGAKLIDMTHREPAWIESYMPGHGRTEIPLNVLVESFRNRQATSAISDELVDEFFAAQTRA